jgi:hypothetical protein
MNGGPKQNGQVELGKRQIWLGRRSTIMGKRGTGREKKWGKKVELARGKGNDGGIGGMANAGNGIGEGMAARDRHGIGRRPWGNVMGEGNGMD